MNSSSAGALFLPDLVGPITTRGLLIGAVIVAGIILILLALLARDAEPAPRAAPGHRPADASPPPSPVTARA